MPNQTSGAKNTPSATWRWAVLTAISVAMFGNYYAYDATGPVADSLQRLLGFSDTQIGTLNAIYSFPILMVLVGGIIVDRFGTRLSTLMFSLICALGAVITAISPLFPVMAAERLILGLGAESMIVATTIAIGQWVRRPPAGTCLRREPEHSARRFLQCLHVDDLVRAAL